MRYASGRSCHNLDVAVFSGAGHWGIPVLRAERWRLGVEWIGFNQASKNGKRQGKGVHFFLDDYQFERIWNDWRKYEPMLGRFDACLTPDFSMYADWPPAVQLWNHYRKHWIGARLQQIGVKVYPTISWSDEDSFDWCFDGEPIGGCVAVSCVGTQKNPISKRLFMAGYRETLRRLKPETILFYGPVPEGCEGNIVRIPAFYEKFKH